MNVQSAQDIEKLQKQITKLKFELNQKTENEIRFRRIQNMALIGFWEYDIINDVVKWSSEAYKIYGISSEKAPPRLEEIIFFSDKKEQAYVQDTINNAIKDGQSFSIDSTIINAKNQKKIVHITGEPFFDQKLNLTYLSGTIIDISSRIKAQDNMRFADFTIESISDGIYWFDNTAKFIRVNEAVCKSLGYTKEELLGKKGRDINPTYTEEKSAEVWEITKKHGVHTFETIHQRKDGSQFPVDITNNILLWKGKEYRCSIVRDITERKEKEKQLLMAMEEVEALKNKLFQENIYLKEEIKLNHNFDEIIAKNAKCINLLKKVEQVGPTKTSVLITGESGTGKELIARALHDLSDRRNNPLVKINCAALPANLVESELFGHEKGAFTGAINRKIGKFELAHNSTIFLDEIGDMPFEIQSKILRVLQESEFERLGGNKTLKVDVRIIAATNRNLEEAISQNKFREDLYYRLNVFPLHIIPLRERKSDIPYLVSHFVKKYSTRVRKNIDYISEPTMKRLKQYDWPGNIRELENIIERAIVISSQNELIIGDWLMNNQILKNKPLSLEQVEKNHIIEVLKLCKGKVSGKNGAAELLELNPKTLESKMKKLGINRKVIFK